ncbi:hypothetical protein M997_3014 [Proteus hauseri ATCC 700826]|uniref:Uncharacterized protein n=1 Tax=Proteus hauseri ATCC 700826 TaxID=1354271 RepID=A0AAJ3LSS7_PROHU|nr:hypothetical protein [Proteus hauseri]OAT45465.1 hypothetical protein M997_3014 [Proteus hauseri ATCC 700826]
MNPFLRKTFIIVTGLFILSLLLCYGLLFNGFEKKWQWEQPSIGNLSDHNIENYSWKQHFNSPVGILIKAESDNYRYEVDINRNVYRQNTPKEYALYFSDKQGVRFITKSSEETFYNAYCTAERCIIFFNKGRKFIDLNKFTISKLEFYSNDPNKTPISLIGGKIFGSESTSQLILADNSHIYFSENEGLSWQNEINVEALMKQYYAEDFGQFTSLNYALSEDSLLIWYNNDLTANTLELTLDLVNKNITQSRWLPIRIRQVAQNEKGEIYFIALSASRELFSIVRYQTDGQLTTLLENGYTYLDDMIVNNDYILVNNSHGDDRQLLIIDLETQQKQYRKKIDRYSIFNPALSEFIRFPEQYTVEQSFLLLGERVKYQYAPIN